MITYTYETALKKATDIVVDILMVDETAVSGTAFVALGADSLDLEDLSLTFRDEFSMDLFENLPATATCEDVARWVVDHQDHEKRDPDIMLAILGELRRAIEKHPGWPTDPLHALAVVQEEVGELQRALLECTYEPSKAEPGAVGKEAIQMAAMGIRFALSLSRYEFTQSTTHATKLA